MKGAKNTMTTTQTTSRHFAYAKDGVSLTFSLRTDISKELKAFLECLKLAIKDVESALTDRINADKK